MQQSKIDREIPRLQKKRTTVRRKFTTLLLFTEKNGLKWAERVPDTRLENNWKLLQQKYPSHSSELDWLSYFLVIIKDLSKPLLEREIALAHLKCFYQETCYWATKKFLEKFYKKHFSKNTEITWQWEDFFDVAIATFESLEKAQNDLKSFQPERAVKKYVQTVFSYNLSNWRDKKIGRDGFFQKMSIDVYHNLEKTGESNCSFKQQITVDIAVEDAEKNKVEILASKQQQERVLVLVESELEIIEKNVDKSSKTKVDKSNLRLWTLLILTYGLNLGQTGASEVLIANQKSINQATISRCIKTFAIKIQVQIIKEFELEMKEVLGESWNDEEEPIEVKMKDWVKRKKKELDDVLKYLWQQRVFTLAIKPKAQQLKKSAVTMPIDLLVRKELDAWCDRSLQISINSKLLSQKSNQKIEQLVREFAAKLAVD